MSSRVLSLITESKRKQKIYEQFILKEKTDFRFVVKDFVFSELQSLQEIEVLQYKINLAVKNFNPPLIVDSEGFYIQGFPAFPGTMSKTLIQGMGWEALLELAKDKKITIFCNLAFVDSLENIFVFSASTQGLLIPTGKNLTGANTLYDFFVPAGQKMSFTQLELMPEGQEYFPRVKAMRQLFVAEVFKNEFIRTKNTLTSKDYF